ncbi:L,D-transpeptidase family protein [Pleionea litopenaei]|uniref:Murein L,D-transpeptidase family protein n=1 Tax=Pleionea litopenaei TaxID=3070815 RepID=A0AA51RW61_9GAMM|nr:murein L,D-transpeptidase family protein [Pleionea sp. HL-JVS1]WMS88771.1 murein L,D-transpeptidase family protein [Pleionea sp. HL-JVS1]
MSKLIISILLIATLNLAVSAEFPTSQRAEKAIKRVEPQLIKELQEQQLSYGAPIFIRVFKQSETLEVWIENAQKQYKKFKTYKICRFSGDLGPKLKQGDWQSPEGFYFVNANRLNPWSRFHLSFNIGYPNQYDRFYKRTGDALMVHGNCVSIGCYAMTDEKIEEIYALAAAALKNGQPFFRVHIFPFELNDRNLAQHKEHRWYDFWKNLQQGYQWFEEHHQPPNVNVVDGKYTFEH